MCLLPLGAPVGDTEPMSSSGGDLWHFPFRAEVWGTVADWFIAIGTVSAVAAAAGYYILTRGLNVTRTMSVRCGGGSRGFSDWPLWPNPAARTRTRMAVRRSWKCGTITRVHDPQRPSSPASVLIRELSGRLIMTRSAQVGYPAILSMTIDTTSHYGASGNNLAPASASSAEFDAKGEVEVPHAIAAHAY
jgi:hypothetical protein